MAKGASKGKTSASSATRKKQANKAAKKAAYERDDDGNLLHPELAEALEKQKQHGLQRGQKKDKSKKDGKGGKKGKVEKKKQYIPPPKPPQPLPDPLDSMGLASLLPADLVVLLRKASKKDVITRCRALEGLLSWVEDAFGKSTTSAPSEIDTEASTLSSDEKKEALVMMLPSWVHLFPRLALSPTRRLRLLTMQIQTLLLEKAQSPDEEASSTRAELLESPQYIEPLLGPWAILCHDTDRTIERLGRSAWNDTCVWTSSTEDGNSTEANDTVKLDLTEHHDTLITHLRTILLSPSPSFALSMTAAHAVATSDPSMSRTSSGYATPSLQTGNVERDAKNRDDNNVEEDTAALDKRLVAGALAVLTSILRQQQGPEVVQSLQDVLSSRLVWASLSPHNLAGPTSRSGKAAAVTSFGYDSPAVRTRAWTLLRTLHDIVPDVLNETMQTIGTVAMTSVWAERDNAVQRALLDAILPLLRKRPELWLIDAKQASDASQPAKKDEGDSDDDDDESDDEDNDDDSSETGSDDDVNDAADSTPALRPKPRTYTSFLQWLQSACGGAPHLGYSAVIVFISTIPPEVLAHNDLDGASDLLTHFFSALYSRPLDFDPNGCRAFFTSFTECVTFLALRMLRSSSGTSAENAASAKELVRVQFGAAWSELVLPKSFLLASLGVGSVDEDSDEASRAQRVKSIGSARIASDLAIQVRRIASSDLQLLEAFLGDIEEDMVEITRAVSSAQRSVESSARTQLLSSFERATSFHAALAPSSGQPASAELRRGSATSLAKISQLAASELASITADIDMARDLKRTRATLLADLLCLLLRAAISHPDALDASTSQELTKAASVSVPQLMGTKCIAPTSAATFLAAYLPLCEDKLARSTIWTETLSSVAALNDLSDRIDALTELFAASEAVAKGSATGELPLPASEAGMDDLALSLVTRLCDGADLPRDLRIRLRKSVEKILTKPASYVDESCVKSMLSIMCSTIEQLRNTLLERPREGEDPTSRKTIAGLVVADLLFALDSWVIAQPDRAEVRRLLMSPSLKGIITAVSEIRYLCQHTLIPGSAENLPIYNLQDVDLSSEASSVIQHIMEKSDPEERAGIEQDKLSSLRDHLLDIHVPVGKLLNSSWLKVDLLPEHEERHEMFVKACKQESHAALLVFDPLISQVSGAGMHSTSSDSLIDGEGLGIFARMCAVALAVFQRDRAHAKRHAELLPYVILLSILIEDDLLLPGASKHALDASVDPSTNRVWLQSSVKAVTALVSSLSSTVTENWHNDIVAALQRSSIIESEKDGIGHVLSMLWQTTSQLDKPSNYLARIFHRLLNAIFSFGTVTEAGAERWLKLGDAVQDRMPAMSLAIFHATKAIAGSSPIYDRLRNGAAAKLSGLGSSTSSDRILSSLRTLVALAPPLDSELSIIPQQRAIFLLKDLEKWYTSDEAEELPEEASTRLAELFVHLLPVVQDVQGSHLDFIFDSIEANLDLCSLEEDGTVAQLYPTLQLLETMRDLASRNANLREYWKDRSVVSIDLVRELFLSLPGTQSVSAPKQACIDLIVELIRETSDMPFKLQETAGPLCKLLVQSPSHEVQVISYRLLSSAIREHVKELVVESAVDREALATEEGQKKLKLPEALVANISDSLSSQLDVLVEEPVARRTAFGYFLSWIAVFEHFENASLLVKSAFLAEIEKRHLLVDSLLPTVFALVGLADDNRRPFDPSRFVIEEVFLDQIDAESSLTVLQVLAAHVYLRALIHVPTTVRSWWVDIKDRQQSMQIASFTTRHCSPVIANRELSHLREPEALSKLQDEALTIKILSTNEVIATYIVDEHPMEIGVKIPADFPLHGVEIRDIQRVGITEAKWRSWLLAVQQLITGQNGLIFDALSLFKRNAEVQFQGLDECAICYSIISPMDRSLPTKPCKTCKNKFHAGCLFKWISTSGASTCPLCRSIL